MLLREGEGGAASAAALAINAKLNEKINPCKKERCIVMIKEISFPDEDDKGLNYIPTAAATNRPRTAPATTAPAVLLECE